MEYIVMCSLESYVNFKACFFTGIALLFLNISQLFLLVSLGMPNFLLWSYFGPFRTSYAILASQAIGLSMVACLFVGADGDRPRNMGPRSGKPFLATIFLAILQLGLYLAFIIIPIDDLQNNKNNVWVSSCIGMSIVDFWTIFVAFKANKKIPRILGYQEIAWNQNGTMKNQRMETISFSTCISFHTLNKYSLLVNPDDWKKHNFYWMMHIKYKS